jgi:hypothetical protein
VGGLDRETTRALIPGTFAMQMFCHGAVALEGPDDSTLVIRFSNFTGTMTLRQDGRCTLRSVLERRIFKVLRAQL